MGSRSYAIRQNAEARTALVAIAAVLLSFGCALWLEGAAHLNVDTPLLAVVLALTLARVQRGADARDRLLGLVVLPAIAVGAGEVGQLMLNHPNFGDTLFAVGVSLSIWLRRFGPRAGKAGTLIALPFVAVLVTPVPVPPGQGATLWSAVVAVIAFFWVSALQLAAQRTGFVRTRTAPGRAAAVNRASSLRPSAGTRMALQMGLVLGAAFTVGRIGFTPHWTWTVLTAFIVSSGNRGRGDVLYKSLLRIVGAAFGTVAATLLAGLFGPRDVRSIVLIFVLLGVANWLRSLNYAYWAGCITAVLSLLQGYFGETRTSLLLTRLEEILVGAAIGVLISWVVLPIRSTDVVRRRIADPLATLTDLLAALRRDRTQLGALGARFESDVEQLGQLAQPVRAHRFFVRRVLRDSRGAQLADAVDAVLACAEPVRALVRNVETHAELLTDREVVQLAAAVTGNVVEARRALGRRPGPGYRPPRPAGDENADADGDGRETALAARAALLEIDAAMLVVTAVFAQPSPAPEERATVSVPVREFAVFKLV
jgi:hypothetical protein